MASFETFKDEYERNWAALRVRPSRKEDAQRQARRLLQGKPTYRECEARTGVPWWFIGLCHYRESNFDFATYLGNGQSLARRTTIVPKGRGPFIGPNAFVDGAVDALRIEGFLGAKDWGIARSLFRLEGFNGYGYHSKGVNSPYLYGGSTAYGPPEARAGKFVRDHVYDPGVVDTQLGTAVILKELKDLDSSIKFDGVPSIELEASHEPDDELANSILWLQQSLNKLGADPRLTEDGENGPRTMTAVSQFQKENGLPDTGLADAATIAAIQRKLLKPTEGGPVALPPSDPLQLLLLVLMLLRKEKSMAGDFTKPGQDVDPISMLLPLLLQSLLLGKQIDVTQLLAALLGKPIATPAPLPPIQNGWIPPSQPQQDLLTILLPLILERLTGKPLPGTTPIPPGAAKPATPPLTTVNGALGQTVGNMLNGRKTAIGVIGLLATTLLPIFFPQLAPIAAVIKTAGSALGDAAAGAAAADAASQVIAPASVHTQSWGGTIIDVAKPLFAALTGWGALGKFDKWFNRVPQ